jgi:hypothetical protein
VESSSEQKEKERRDAPEKAVDFGSGILFGDTGRMASRRE